MPPGRPRVEKFQNLWDILKHIEEISEDREKTTIYRGHTSYQHKLRPSIFRSSNSRIRNNEKTVLREIITKHPAEFSGDIGTFEKLVRIQHYGLPTRLLDVTYNPLVAVYFACEDVNTRFDPEIVAITVEDKNIKYFDSDTVRCLSNLANLTNSEKQEISEIKNSDDLNKSRSGTRLHDFILQERPNFQQRIDIEHLRNFILVNPRLNNPRIQAQVGAFLLFGVNEELKSGAKDFKINKIRVDKDKIESIRKSVELIGITESTIYPEISRTSVVIKRKYGIS